MEKRFKARKLFMFIPLAILGIAVFGFVVMILWNALLPAVLGVKAISFWQALGILVLSKILFGGFSGGRGGMGYRGRQWKQQMQDKWAVMNPEEREKLKAEWKNRCGGSWSPSEQDARAAE
jgi:Ca2+/H+ antiporter, TMEM165/GDT1 family